MNTPLPGANAVMSPATADFGSQTVMVTSAPQTETLTNTGSAPLIVGGVTHLGGEMRRRSRRPTTAARPWLLEASCTVNVTFTPTATGTQTANLSLIGTAANASLTGIGTAAAMTVSPRTATLTPNETQQFTASRQRGHVVRGRCTRVAPRVRAPITAAGLYTPPSTPGQHIVTAMTGLDTTGHRERLRLHDQLRRHVHA